MTGLRKSSLLPLGEILHRSSYLHAFKVDLGGRLSIDRSDVVKLLKNSIFNMLLLSQKNCLDIKPQRKTYFEAGKRIWKGIKPLLNKTQFTLTAAKLSMIYKRNTISPRQQICPSSPSAGCSPARRISSAAWSDRGTFALILFQKVKKLIRNLTDLTQMER